MSELTTVDPQGLAGECKDNLVNISKYLLAKSQDMPKCIEAAIRYANRGGRYPKSAMETLFDVTHMLPKSWGPIAEAVETRRLLDAGEYVSTAGISRLAGISTRQVGVYVREGRLRGERSGRWYLIAADDAKEFLRARNVQGF